MELNRPPCPLSILDDCGAAFAMGAIGGSVHQSIKGFMNAPSGFRYRILGSFTTAIEKAPQTGGRFSVWGATFSTVNCALVASRKKEDPWNSIISGMATGAILSARGGVSTMVGHAVIGGVLMSLIEGIGIIVNNIASNEQYQPVPPEMKDPDVSLS